MAVEKPGDSSRFWEEVEAVAAAKWQALEEDSEESAPDERNPVVNRILETTNEIRCLVGRSPHRSLGTDKGEIKTHGFSACILCREGEERDSQLFMTEHSPLRMSDFWDLESDSHADVMMFFKPGDIVTVLIDLSVYPQAEAFKVQHPHQGGEMKGHVSLRGLLADFNKEALRWMDGFTDRALGEFRKLQLS